MERLSFTVSDNGPGVPQESLPGLFDPFFRLEAARDRERGGTGLGLAIVQTCISACAGAVTARNCAGGGFEIEFRLPAAWALHSAAAPDPAASARRTFPALPLRA